jgi:hypothetical protein
MALLLRRSITAWIRAKSILPRPFEQQENRRERLSLDAVLVRKTHDTEVTADAGAHNNDVARGKLAVLARADAPGDFAGDRIAAALERGIECGLESGCAG